MKNRRLLQTAVISAGLLLTLSGQAEIASPTMLSNTCAGCHGTNGNSGGPAIPSIAGLSHDFFVEAMQEYREGERPSTIMERIAKGYSDEEIEAMAGYFGEQTFIRAKQDSDAAMVEDGGKLHEKYCEKCHSEGGTLADDDSGFLGGQWTPYIQYSLDDFLSGDREMTKKMKKKVDKLLEKEDEGAFTKLLQYFASQQ